MSSITRSDDLRISNRRTVLRAVRRNSAKSRTFLSEATGLSAATVSAICNDLMEAGVILESSVEPASASAAGKSRRGRPRMQLTLNPMAAMVATVTLTLNEIEVMLIDYAGAIVYAKITHLSTLSLSRSAISKRVIRCVDDALANSHTDNSALTHIEVAFQGVIDVNEGILIWSPIISHNSVPLKTEMQDYFGITVRVGNDCSKIANALSGQHAELGATFAALLFSHGVGMGIFHDNNLISGARSSATEFGHMLHVADGALCRCGRRGCIEAYAADYAIWRKATARDQTELPNEDLEFSNIRELIAIARKRNGRERKAFIEAGHAIGTGLGNLFALLDSFPVALIGPITEAFDLMEDAIRGGIQHGMRGYDGLSVPILCFHDERALIRQGCAKTALDAVDHRCFVSGPVDYA